MSNGISEKKLGEGFSLPSGKEIIKIAKSPRVLEALRYFLRINNSKNIMDALHTLSKDHSDGIVNLNKVDVQRTIYNGYAHIVIPKPDGKSFRSLSIPENNLKGIQSHIHQALSSIPLSRSVTGGEPNTSVMKNIEPHLRNRYLYTTDIQDAYPSINPERVFKNFKKGLQPIFNLSFSHLSKIEVEEFCYVLTYLVMHNNQLPQGSPASSRILNIVFGGTDAQVSKYLHSDKSGVIHPIYTRYIDDIAVSFEGFNAQVKLRDMIKGYEKDITNILNDTSRTRVEMNEDQKEILTLLSLKEKFRNLSHSDNTIQSTNGKRVILEKIMSITQSLSGMVDSMNHKHPLHRFITSLLQEIKDFYTILSQKDIESGMELVRHAIRGVIIKNGWRIKDKKEHMREPDSSTSREITNITIGHDGKIGISRDKMNSYIKFVQICAHYPSKLPQKFIDQKTGLPDGIKLAYVLNGIRNFITEVKKHVPDKFEEPYILAKAKYFATIKIAPNRYSYSDINGASML